MRDGFFQDKALQRVSVNQYLALMDRFILQSAGSHSLQEARDLMRVKLFFENNVPSVAVFRNLIAVDLISGSFCDERFLCSREEGVSDDAFILSVIEEFALGNEVRAAGHGIEGDRIVCRDYAQFKQAVDQFYGHFVQADENGKVVNRLTVFMDSVSDAVADANIGLLKMAPGLRL